MGLDRRQLLTISALTGAAPVLAPAAAAAPLSTLGVDALQLGVRAGGAFDQTVALQNAIDQTAGARVPLILGPGEYRASELKLPTGAQIVGVRGATRLILEQGAGLILARGADHVTLAGLVLDGRNKPLPAARALVHLAQGRDIRILDCAISNAGGHGVVLEESEGVVTGTTIANVAGSGILAREARGLTIQNVRVRNAADGIVVWRKEKGDDGTRVLENSIANVANDGIRIERAGNVLVRGNRIRAARSALRGRAARHLHIVDNVVSEIGEAAFHCEATEGALIAHNTVDGAALGVALVDFGQGGRLATVQGNLIRNLKPPQGTSPGENGVGIMVEADAAVAGNVIENAHTGIMLGWGRHLRDASVTGNVVRAAGYGIAASISTGAGSVVIAGNLIAEATRGAIVGMDFAQIVPGDLAKDSDRHAHLAIRGNRVR